MESLLLDPLTRERRYAVCVHESAHAVVHSIGGAQVYSLAVAPVGSRGDWSYAARKGDPMKDLWGVCEISDMGTLGYLLRWSEADGGYALNRLAWKEYRSFLKAMPKGGGLSPVYRNIRAHVCGALAGPIGEAIFAGEDPPIEPIESGPDEDLTKAEAWCWLLPFTREYEYLHQLTTDLLAEPQVWGSVLAIADALDEAGTLDYEPLKALLPTRKDWPSSPRSSADWKGYAALRRELRGG